MRIQITQHKAARIVVWYSTIVMTVLFIGGVVSSKTIGMMLANIIIIPILFLLWTAAIGGKK